MNRSVKHAAVITTVLGVMGIAAVGCLDRDVVSRPPSVNTIVSKTVTNQSIDKVDILFMIDNSVSMGDKQSLLALAVPNMISRLVTPNCLDANGNPVQGMTANVQGQCPSGLKPEFAAVHDMHIGILSSSLGSRGGDVCPDNTPNPVNNALLAHYNDNGELINRTGVAGNPTVENTIGDAPSPLNFLSYFPSVGANMGKPTPPTPPITMPAQLITDFTSLIEGVHEHGCGFEAQNEAWYRFLIQPDPFASITVNGSAASLTGIDETILKQRADFLRPDSLVAVIVVTDENEEADDPLTVNHQGWTFNVSSFPNSPSGGGAPQGTVECQSIDPNNPSSTGPNDPKCQSCAFIQGSSNFATECPKNGSAGANGYLDPSNDSPNLRFFHQKERFGLFAGYPTSRYIRGLQKSTVPSVGLAYKGDTDHEHDGNGNYIGDQDGNADCVNPLYATNLPTSASSDLCHLSQGVRTPDLVYYAAIAGVPHELLQATAGSTADPGEVDSTGKPLCAAGTPQANCPQKSSFTAADWKLIMGQDPEHYDFRGADFHMVESIGPRTMNTGGWANAATCTPPMTGAPPLPGQPGADPINGCEFNTNNADLQFACVFPLVQDMGGTIQQYQKTCDGNPPYGNACDCTSSALDNKSQLCSGTNQVYAKAYPSVREMIIANAMSNEHINGQVSNQGIVSSLCPIALDIGQSTATAASDPLFGYNPAVNAIIDRLKVSLSSQCATQKLVEAPPGPGVTPGTIDCLVLVALPSGTGGGSCTNPGNACNPQQGLVGPSTNPNDLFQQSLLDKFCSDHTQNGASPQIQASQPVCALKQVILSADNSQDCSKATGQSGWCYIQGAAATALGCPQPYTIAFTPGEPPTGTVTALQCLESAVSVIDAGGGGG